MISKAPNALYALVLREKNVFKECPKLVVLWPVSHNSLDKEFHSTTSVPRHVYIH